MSLEDTQMPEELATTSFRLEDGVLICSGPGIPERRIPIAQIRAWVDTAQGKVQTFRLMMRAGRSIDLQDPNEELEDILSVALPDSFFSF